MTALFCFSSRSTGGGAFAGVLSVTRYRHEGRLVTATLIGVQLRLGIHRTPNRCSFLSRVTLKTRKN
jgi:hypothetical protein